MLIVKNMTSLMYNILKWQLSIILSLRDSVPSLRDGILLSKSLRDIVIYFGTVHYAVPSGQHKNNLLYSSIIKATTLNLTLTLIDDANVGFCPKI